MKNGVCPKCAGKKIVHLDHVIDSADWSGLSHGGPDKRNADVGGSVYRHIAIGVETYETWLTGKTVERRGLVCATEAYVCSGCGFFEEYVREPESVNWDDLHGATWLH